MIYLKNQCGYDSTNIVNPEYNTKNNVEIPLKVLLI